MRRIVFPAVLLILISLVSCSRGPVFEKYFTFQNNTWDRFNQIHFNFPVEDTESVYTISLILKPTRDFEYPSMPVYIILQTPSGEERMDEVKVQVKQGNTFIETEKDQPLLYKTVLWKDLSITEKGNCKLSIENMVPKIQTLGLEQIGILVEKGKKKEE